MSAVNLRHSVANVRAPMGKEEKARRHRHGIKIKVSTPGSASAGAGSVLRSLRSSNHGGKARKRGISSPIDNRGGKRLINSNFGDDSCKGLSNLEAGAIDSNIKFAMGSKSVCTKAHKSNDSNVESCGNDGTFIKLPLDKSPSNSTNGNPVAKSSGLETGSVNPSMGDVGNTMGEQTSSRDGITGAKTGTGMDKAGSSQWNEHTSIEDVGKGILKKPIGPLFSVQFGKNDLNNPFVKKPLSNGGSAWNARGIYGSGKSVLSNQFTADVDRFAEKLKQGSEELALKMEYTPNAVSKGGNGFKRIQFSAEEIMSGVGKPMVMDKMTKERCLKKAGKLDFARVLVEVSAKEELPSILEIEYPPLGNRPAKIGKLEVKYQWKPPLCTHCSTFGHSTRACKVRPRTVEEEIVKNAKVNDVNVGDGKKKESMSGMDNDGFVTVGKNNKPVGVTTKADCGFQNRDGLNGNKQGLFQKKNFNKQSGGAHGNGKNNYGQRNNGNTSKDQDMDQCNVEKVASDQEEFFSKVWPNLKDEVDILMEAGIFPSKAVRLEWNIHQLDYFYKNCHKYQLDPSYEDEDVESDVEGIAADMKPEYDVDAAASSCLLDSLFRSFMGLLVVSGLSLIGLDFYVMASGTIGFIRGISVVGQAFEVLQWAFAGEDGD
ncbi:hypothetical protein CTI12_AA101160 [Artemisia annua]|uniref:DUF4283 domain-containing protein n=1 Tax=Artemisia annua TaxID=35608 RepID=A0A2U1PX91_ARTAN|nr:hypothetical protein CTI12_AA101160 [Artemisia annua]